MKQAFTLYLILLFTSITILSQNNNQIICEVKNNDVKIKLHKLVEFNSKRAKEGNKFLVADITIENLSSNKIAVGSEYTMGITIKDVNGNEYRSGLKGEGIVTTYLSKNDKVKQDQKAHNLCFSDNFPAKTIARSYLCGFEVPKDAKIVSFGVKKKNMWSAIK